MFLFTNFIRWDIDHRFEKGPRIKGSVYLDLDDISSQFDLFPTLNPKKLPHMMPPMVCIIDHISIDTIILFSQHKLSINFKKESLYSIDE